MIYEDHRDAQEYFSLGKNTSNVHFHRSIEMVYCLESPKNIFIDGQELTLHPGELLIVPPLSTHFFPEPEQYNTLCVVFPVKFTDDLENQVGQMWFDRIIVKDPELTEGIYRHLLGLENTQNTLLRKGIYNYVLGLLLDQIPLIPRQSRPESNFALQTLTYLEKNYTQKLSLEQAAASLGYNRCYFSSLFKKTFRTGFCQYLTALRIRKSIPLLQTQSISEAAYAVGFGSLQNYYTAFKKVCGMPPAAYIATQSST